MYHRGKKTALSQFVQLSESPVFGKKTINGLLRSILEPIVENNSKALIFTRLINKENIEGLIRRIEYSRNIEMYNYNDIAKLNNLVELEFVLITSNRFSALLMWDYSTAEDKDASRIYFLINSSQINDVFELVQSNLKEDFSAAFYEYKPERRENELMNKAVFNVFELLNEKVLETDFQEVQSVNSISEAEFSTYKENAYKNTKEVCHEIKNQLSILDIYSKLVEKQLGEGNKHISVIKKSLNIISSQLEELKDYDDVVLEDKSLDEVLLKTVEMVAPILAENKNEVVLKTLKLNVNIDENKYIAALINILKNASESTQEDKIEVELVQEDGFAKVFITNHGKKIENPQMIFTSGFSTKGTLGVGLSVSQKHLEAQFSTLELLHSDDEYTSFTIVTPLG